MQLIIIKDKFRTVRKSVNPVNELSPLRELMTLALPHNRVKIFIIHKDNNEGCKNWQLHSKFTQL